MFYNDVTKRGTPNYPSARTHAPESCYVTRTAGRRRLPRRDRHVATRTATADGRLSRRLSILAAVSLALGLLLAPAMASAQGETASSILVPGGDVWSATMTVGNNRGLLGYSTLSERRVGALSTSLFSWRGREYTVTNIVYNRTRGAAQAWDVLVDFWPPLPREVESLALQLGDQWLNLTDAQGGTRQFVWYGVEFNWRFRDEIPVRLREFPEAFSPRSIDGRDNNRFNPEWGMADTRLLRRAGVSLGYAMSSEPPSDLPGTRFISNALSAQAELTVNVVAATDMVWQWGQFLDHDITFTPEGASGETMRIPIPRGDPVFDPFRSGLRTMPFNRSAFDPATGGSPEDPRAQVNTITAFIDASNVYGSGLARTLALRTNDGTGRLKTSSGGRLLPYNADGIENDGGTRRDLFVAGDLRSNEQVGLTALHTLFVREHNRLADDIAAEHPDMSGQEIFELARKIVGAQMQVITYREFLPVVLGHGALGPYEGYDPEVDPTITNEFSAAAYRFGHTMLSSNLLRVDDSGEEYAIPLRTAFFNPSFVADHGISGLLRGLTRQQAQRVDALLVDDVRNLLFGPPGGPGRDLAALNIQRGRDHGLADYNTVRAAYGMSPAATFAEVTSEASVVDSLVSTYSEIGLLDLWVGGLAEDPLPKAMLGETFHTILVDQFIRLRDGDRYWFENDPYFLANPTLLSELRATTLATIIRRNTSITDGIPDNVFGGPPPPPPPRISVVAATSPVTEGVPAIFTLRRTGATDERLTVTVRLTETGTMLPVRQGPTEEVTFEAGRETATLTLATVADSVMEAGSTVSVTISDAEGYEADEDANAASVAVNDNDSVEIELHRTWTVFEWPGFDSIAVADALREGALLDKVIVVYQWDESAQTWLAFSPGLEDVSALNTLTTFERGRIYWVAVSEPVTWTFATGQLADSALAAGPGP